MKPFKIVIVNDEAEPLSITSGFLTKAGYQVVTAASGLEGLVTVQAEQPDIVILDIVMPDINGLEICSLIKADPLLKNTYVLLLSGLKITSESQAAGLEAGADDYIASPYNPRELLVRVKNLITLKTTRHALKVQLEQQQIIANLSQLSLEDASLPELFAATIRELSAVLRAPIAGIFQYSAGDQTLLLTSGVGWELEDVCLDAAAHTLPGHSLSQSEPSIVEDIDEVTAFELPPVFSNLHIASCLFVPIGHLAEPFGVLLLAAQERDHFSQDSIWFLQAVNNILNGSIRRQNMLRALEQSAHKFSNVIEQANYGFTLVDEKGTIINWNAAQERITGYERAAVLGTDFITLFRNLALGCDNAAYNHEQTLADISTLLNKGEVNNKGLAGCVYNFKHHAGHVIKVHFALFPIHTDFGVMLFSIARDVTEEFGREALLQQQQRLAIVGQMSAHIAHNLNNYLAAPILYTELMMTDSALPIQYQAYLKTILEQNQNAANLVSQILDFSRKAMMRLEQVDLAAFLEDAVIVIEKILPKNIQFHKRLNANGSKLIMKADPNRLQQMLINLCLNAKDAMPKGGDLTIMLASYSGLIPFRWEEQAMIAEQWVVLTVTDTGMGIKPEIIGKVFDPFFSTKHPTEGSGMGLAQAYGIASQHGGTISVDSRVNAGTTFTIYLPVEIEAPTPTPVIQRDVILTKHDASKGRVLVIDGNDSFRNALVDVLEIRGYELAVAKTVAEGLAICRGAEGAYDLVISDIQLLTKHSNDLLESFAAEYPATQHILLTDYAPSKENTLSFVQTSEKISKPVNLKQLLEMIRSLLEGIS